MPFRLEIKNDVFHLFLDGAVTDDDLRVLAKAVIEAETGLAVVPHRVTHLSEAESLNLAFHDLWEVAEWRRAYPPPNPIKSAIVAAKPVQIGFARMFQSLNDHPKVTVAIFTDAEAAVAWILADEPVDIADKADDAFLRLRDGRG